MYYTLQICNLFVYVCISNGKYRTSISQEDLKMAGGVHFTFPSLLSTALVIVVTTYSPSALKDKKKQNFHQYSGRLGSSVQETE